MDRDYRLCVLLRRCIKNDIPDKIMGQITHLTTLELSNSKLYDEDVECLWHRCCAPIKKIGLNGNMLQSLPDGVGDLSKLRSLDLSNNNLTALSEKADYLANIERKGS